MNYIVMNLRVVPNNIWLVKANDYEDAINKVPDDTEHTLDVFEINEYLRNKKSDVIELSKIKEE